MNTARYERLVAVEIRAHHRFLRRSARSIAMFPQDRFTLHRSAVQATRLAESLRVELSRERVRLLQLSQITVDPLDYVRPAGVHDRKGRSLVIQRPSSVDRSPAVGLTRGRRRRHP